MLRVKSHDWFVGVRLSTDEQLKLVQELLDSPETTSICTGDTLVQYEDGGESIGVYREDFMIRVPEGESHVAA